jgi:hypothetical protein
MLLALQAMYSYINHPLRLNNKNNHPILLSFINYHMLQ